MTAPYVPKFECNYWNRTDTDQYLKIRHPATVGTWKQYDIPATGHKSHSELLDAAAAYFEGQFGGNWSWIINYSTKGAYLTWDTGSDIDFERTSNLGTYLGILANVSGQSSPLSSGNEPEGIWYPSRPLVREEPTVVDIDQIAWWATDEDAAVIGPGQVTHWAITALVDNASDDWAEYIELYDFVMYAADDRAFQWFREYTDDHDAATTLFLAFGPEFRTLEYRPPDEQDRRFFEVDWSCIQDQVGMA